MNIIYKEPKSRDYSFCAFGKQWKSIAQCCEYYGIEYHSVMQYKSDTVTDLMRCHRLAHMNCHQIA